MDAPRRTARIPDQLGDSAAPCISFPLTWPSRWSPRRRRASRAPSSAATRRMRAEGSGARFDNLLITGE